MAGGKAVSNTSQDTNYNSEKINQNHGLDVNFVASCGIRAARGQDG